MQAGRAARRAGGDKTSKAKKKKKNLKGIDWAGLDSDDPEGVLFSLLNRISFCGHFHF